MTASKISRCDLEIQLSECHETAMFLSVAVGALMREIVSYNDKHTVPTGAEKSIRMLADKLKHLIEQI